jgi:hypothetical protein
MRPGLGPVARLPLRAAVLLMVGVVLASCAAQPPAVVAPEVGAGSDVYGGFPIDPPADDEVVLTLVGSRTVELTMGELDALAVDEVTFIEPFVKVEQSFRVIPLADLFELAGITPRDPVDTIALNDYRYSDTARALLDADALLAVGRDGGPIPMDEGGPIRLVFDTGSGYHGFLDAWNWSLRSIRVVAGS